VQGETTAIAAGVAPGDSVVIDGADKLREGAKVEVITREVQAPTAPDGGRRGAKRDRPPGAGAPRNGPPGQGPPAAAPGG